LQKLLRHDVGVQLRLACGLAAVHFTIDAVEIAVPVRIHVHTDRQAPRAWGKDNVNKPVLEKVAGATEGGFAGDVDRRGAAPLLLERLVSDHWLGINSFHNI
jgi:hypothetical protein